jgi:hypothetical protein
MSKADMSRPAASVAAVTKSDSADIAKLDGNYPRALYIGVSGNVVVVFPDGTSGTFLSVPIGILPVQARRVGDSTTATNILALY